MPTTRRKGAFTLIELVVAALILAVLAAASVVAYGRFTAQSRTAAAEASAVQIRDAISAAAAAVDETPGAFVAAAIAAGGQSELMSRIGAQWSGSAVMSPGAAGRPATLLLAGGQSGTFRIALPNVLGAGMAVTHEEPPAGTLTLASSVPAGLDPWGLSFTTDGQYVATTSLRDDSVVVLRVDPKTGALTTVGTWPTGGRVPRGAAFSPNGPVLATVNSESDSVTTFVVNEQTGALTVAGTYPAGDMPWNLAFSPDGQLLVTASMNDRTITLYRVNRQTGTLTATGTWPSGGAAARALAFSPDGSLLAVVNRDSANIVTFTVDRQAGTVAQVDVAQAGTTPISVVFTPDGQRLLVGNYGANSISNYRISSTGVLSERRDFATGGNPRMIAINQAGTLVATADEAGTATLLTVAPDGSLSKTQSLSVAGVLYSAQFDPTGTFLAVSSWAADSVFMLRVG